MHAVFFRIFLAASLLAAGTAAAAPGNEDDGLAAPERIEQAAQLLASVQQALDDADARETLATLSERAQRAQHQADAAALELQPELDQFDARLAQLGPAADTGEDAGIIQLRQRLERERGQLDAQIKRGKLLAEDARQLAESIEKRRARQFSRQLGQKVGSPLSPSLWRQFATHLPDDLARLRSLYRQARTGLAGAVQRHGWGVPLAGLAGALLLVLPLRLWLRGLGRGYAASPRAPAGRLRRTGLAVWLLLVGTLSPGMAAVVLVGCLHAAGAIPPRLEAVAGVFTFASFVAAFIAAVASSQLLPRRPSWRLLDIDDAAAARLQQFARGAALLTWASLLLRDINRAARTSEVATLLLDGVIALTCVALISGVLATLAGLHRRRALAAARLEREEAAPGKPARRAPRSGWLVVVRLGGYLTVLAALVASLLGYLNFALFITQQMLWVTVVVLATTLLLKFADDLALWLLAPHSTFGRLLRLSTGMSAARLAQGGVLLSAASRVLLVLAGITALVAPFGNVGALYGGLQTLLSGVMIGGHLLRPSAVFWALVVLLLGLALMRVVQRWLVDTWLPSTGLDAGARNSISTVTYYLGIVLAVLWSLATLGIGLEKLALLASALSVGIGFGLQAITQNFVSGLILLAERPVKIGDWVKIGDLEGDIRRISVRSTQIQVGDRSTLIVPNSELITKTIRNMTTANALGRIQLQFSVPLGTDVAMLRGLLMDIYAANPTVLEQPAPSVFIDSIGGGLVAINSFAYVPTSRHVYATRSELLFELLQQMTAHDIALVTPTEIRVLHDPQET